MSLENEYVLFCRIQAFSNMASAQLSRDGLPVEFSDVLGTKDPTIQMSLATPNFRREIGGGSFSTRSPPRGQRETGRAWMSTILAAHLH